MKIFIARMTCADYYCQDEHIIGVYSVKELAEAAQVAAKEAEPRWLQIPGVEELDLNPVSPRIYDETM